MEIGFIMKDQSADRNRFSRRYGMPDHGFVLKREVNQHRNRNLYSQFLANFLKFRPWSIVDYDFYSKKLRAEFQWSSLKPRNLPTPTLKLL
jgi:hypothetical protein